MAPYTVTNRPLAAAGLTSYRYLGRYGYVMIGATDARDALCEAARSVTGPVTAERLEVWSSSRACYVRLSWETDSDATPLL